MLTKAQVNESDFTFGDPILLLHRNESMQSFIFVVCEAQFYLLGNDLIFFPLPLIFLEFKFARPKILVIAKT